MENIPKIRCRLCEAGGGPERILSGPEGIPGDPEEYTVAPEGIHNVPEGVPRKGTPGAALPDQRPSLHCTESGRR